MRISVAAPKFLMRFTGFFRVETARVLRRIVCKPGGSIPRELSQVSRSRSFLTADPIRLSGKRGGVRTALRN